MAGIVRRTTSGGKAGRGRNKTASFLAIDTEFSVEKLEAGRRPSKYFRYQMNSPNSRMQALKKAEAWAKACDAPL